MTIPPLRFALIGCGAIASTHANALKSLPALATLAACVDHDPALAVAFAAQHNCKALSWLDTLRDDNIEAIALCTPSGLHGQLACAALAAGKHVIIEKPMEISVAACEKILTSAVQSGRQLAIISQHRFDPSAQSVRSIIEQNKLGRLIAVDARIPWWRTQAYYDSGAWRGTWALDGGGCLMNQGIHTVDLMLWLCGPVQEVFARTSTAAHERIEVEDLVCATLSFTNGAIGTLFASTATYPGYPARLALYGTEGTAIIEGDELHTLAIKGHETVLGPAAAAHAVQIATGGTRSAVQHATAAPAASSEWQWGDAHRAQYVDFIAAIQENRAPLVDGKSGRDAVRLITTLYESARNGRPLPV
jgi:UDP-N-acetyl-2-amino-2-deoxyglucuronate dehydrogenase